MISFSKLPPTDTLRVRFVSQGCFHSSCHELTFRRGTTTTVAVASVRQEWSHAQVQQIDVQREELGQVGLTDADLDGLDELLRLYRSKPRGDCTTRDTITISQFHDGEIIATEEFLDRSGATYHVKNVTTFPEIVRRL